MENVPSDYYVKKAQFVKRVYRDVYPAIDPTAASNSQEGKVVVITGASKGIGRRGFVRSFAQAGVKGLVMVARSADSLEDARKEVFEINQHIKVLAVPTDLLDPKSIKALWEKVKEEFGHADVLINNAGTALFSLVSDADPDAWWLDFVFKETELSTIVANDVKETNGRAAFLLSQGFLKLLGKEGKGTIVNLTSALALTAMPIASSYGLSKLVVIQLQAYIAAEHPNITAVALHPGIVKTDMTHPIFEPFALDTPALIGGVGVWLSTEQAAFLSGKYIESNWSVEDLVAKKDEIVSKGLLSIILKGEFGSSQFE